MTDEEYNIAKRDLELEILRKQASIKEQELLKLQKEGEPRKGVLTPVTTTIIVALVGVFGTLTANLIQQNTAMKIEKQKAEFLIYSKAQESNDPEQAARILDFYVSVGVLDGTKGQFSEAVKTGDSLNAPPVFDERRKTVEEVYPSTVLSTVPKESQGAWKFDKHFLSGDGVTHRLNPNTSGAFKAGYPDAIVLHFTATRTLKSALAGFDALSTASAHFVVDKTGEVVQLIPVNYIAYGAGLSSFDGREAWNKYAIQIDMVNAGRLTKRDGKFFDGFNGEFPDDDKVVTARHKHESTESYWEAFTPEQVAAVKKLCVLLMSKYKITYVLGHDDISPHRKTDPGPAFPLDSLQMLLKK